MRLQRVIADGEVDVPFGDGQGPGDRPLQPRDDLGDKGRFEGEDRQIIDDRELGEHRLLPAPESAGAAAGDEDHGFSMTAHLAQPLEIGQADLDPLPHPPVRLLGPEIRLIRRGNPLGKAQIFAVAEGIGKEAGDEPFIGLGRVTGDSRFEFFIKVAIEIRELDGGAVDRGRQGHGDFPWKCVRFLSAVR